MLELAISELLFLNQVSLNKDSALLIMRPEENHFPHPLKAVLSACVISISRSNSSRKKLEIRPKCLEFEFAKMLWESFMKMITILRKDEMPLTAGSLLSRQDIHSFFGGWDIQKI